MKAQDLKNSILQLAIQGKLVEQREEEGTAKELIEQIKAEKEKLIKEKKIKKEKPLPEITEDEILFDIPESWEWVRLSDLSLFIKAGGDKPKDFLNSKTETHTVPVIANGIQNDGIIGYTKEATVEEPCITVSGRGTIGFSCLRTEPFTPVVRLLVINISKQLDNNYIKNVLTALLERGVGTSIKQLTVPMIEPKIIPLPPLEEQKRIVEKIEELMPYVEQYDKAYTEVDELNKKFPKDMEKSILQYAIQGKLVEQLEEEGTAEELYQKIQAEKEKLIKEGKIKKTKPLPEITEDEIPFNIPENWKWVRLGNIVSVLGDGIHGTPVYDDRGSYYFINGNNLNNGVIEIKDNTKKVDEEQFLKHKRELNDNTVFVSINGTIGNVAFYAGEKVILGKSACYFNLMNEDFKYYLYWVIKTKYFLDYAIKKATGTTIKNVSLATMKEFVVPLPPLAEQKRIVEKIEELLPYTKQLVKKLD